METTSGYNTVLDPPGARSLSCETPVVRAVPLPSAPDRDPEVALLVPCLVVGEGSEVMLSSRQVSLPPASNFAVSYELVQRDNPETAIRSSLALKTPLYCVFFASSYKIDWCLCPLLSP